jgi:hypothetical protein
MGHEALEGLDGQLDGGVESRKSNYVNYNTPLGTKKVLINGGASHPPPPHPNTHTHVRSQKQPDVSWETLFESWPAWWVNILLRGLFTQFCSYRWGLRKHLLIADLPIEIRNDYTTTWHCSLQRYAYFPCNHFTRHRYPERCLQFTYVW